MSEDRNALAEDRTDFAEDRTDFAEDRTLLANERTFAGWIRTGLAAVGLGIAFNALFGKLSPAWLARAIASLFILVGLVIFYLAQRNGSAVCARLQAHRVEPLGGMNLRLVAGLMAAGSIALLVGIWLLDIDHD